MAQRINGMKMAVYNACQLSCMVLKLGQYTQINRKDHNAFIHTNLGKCLVSSGKIGSQI